MFEDEDVVIEEDYYARLNISRNASQEDITSAYRRLSRIYHPDKHLQPEEKKKADLLFSKIKKSYEVLVDPHQRAIYDTVGVKGLKTHGWEIVQRTKTPQEIREEYERLAEERNERRMQQRTNPKGSITVNINATDIFNAYDIDADLHNNLDNGDAVFPAIEISGMSISQSIEAPITLRDTVTLSGQLSTQNGTGNGSISISSRRLLLTNGWIEGEFTAGNGPSASFKLFRLMTRTIFVNFDTQFKITPNGVRMGLRSTLGMPLDSYTHGYLTWNVGFASSMSTMLIRDTEYSHWSVMIGLSLINSFVSGHYLFKMPSRDLRLRCYAKIGTINSMVETTAEKKISELSTCSATVAVGVPTGVVLKLKFVRANQSYIFPIQMCDDPEFIPIVYAAVTPAVLWFAVKNLLIDPFLRHQKQKEIQRQREINKNKLIEKQREAKAAVDLMRSTYMRIRDIEETNNGLIILQALYGLEDKLQSIVDDQQQTVNNNNNTNYNQSWYGHQVIDVTVPLQCLVIDSQLTLHDASKSQLTGFYDPCVGEDKCLFIRYQYRSHLYRVVIQDNQPLRIPKQSDRINGS